MSTSQHIRPRNSTSSTNFNQYTRDNDSSHFKDKPSPSYSSSKLNVLSGLPTYDQYKRIETAYLASLHSRKRDKALINQAMFDRIWDTFMNPHSRHETPQFRFWVRKMFTLSEPPTFLSSSGEPAEAIQPLVLHDNRPVAIQEQIYDIICYCHARADHGGRDKTRAVVREHYSWVPKELISQFVKACPTCTLKKCGKNAEVAAILERQMPLGLSVPTKLPVQRAPQLLSLDVRTRPATPNDLHDGQANHWSFSSESHADFLQGSLSDSCGTPSDFASSTASSRRPSPVPGMETNQTRPLYLPDTPDMTREMQSHAMSREVSLYRGLPNGWQYHSKYPEAIEAHSRGKRRKTDASLGDLKRVKRPRIPSVLPLDHVIPVKRVGIDKENKQDSCPDRLVTLPSLKEALSDGLPNDNSLAMTPLPRIPQSSLPQSLQRFQVFLPVETQAEGAHSSPTDLVFLQEGNRNGMEIQSSENMSWEPYNAPPPASHASSSEHHAQVDYLGLKTTNAHLPKSQTLRLRSALDATSQDAPLRSFQSFQHLQEWKNGGPPSHPQDDGIQSPFSPRSSFVSSTPSSCFSTFHMSSPLCEEWHSPANPRTFEILDLRAPASAYGEHN